MAPLDDVAFFRWAAKYKFTLAMENYVCDDYVTEKLWRPLRLGSIPIVFGAPNVKVLYFVSLNMFKQFINFDNIYFENIVNQI